MRLERWLYILPLLLRNLFRRRRVEQELDEELQFHLERECRERIAHGADPDQARRADMSWSRGEGEPYCGHPRVSRPRWARQLRRCPRSPRRPSRGW